MFCSLIASITSARNQAQFGHQVGLEPDAHAIVSAAEKVDLGDAGNAQDLIAKIDAGSN